MTRFADVRQRRGLTNEALAVKSGVSITTIRNANGGYVPGHKLVRAALAQALDVAEDELFDTEAR